MTKSDKSAIISILGNFLGAGIIFALFYVFMEAAIEGPSALFSGMIIFCGGPFIFIFFLLGLLGLEAAIRVLLNKTSHRKLEAFLVAAMILSIVWILPILVPAYWIVALVSSSAMLIWSILFLAVLGKFFPS